MEKKNMGKWNRKLLAAVIAVSLLAAAVVPISAAAVYTDGPDDLLLLAVESIWEWGEGYMDPTPLYEKSEGAPDGGNYVAYTGTDVALFSRSFDPVDVSGYQDGYFHLFLYVQDASRLTGGQIELTSSGNADGNEMNWDILNLGLVSGWNELYLPMNAAGEQGGAADRSAINYFRVFFLFGGTMEVGIDHMSMTAQIRTPEPEPTESQPTEPQPTQPQPTQPIDPDPTVLLNVDSIWEWNEGYNDPPTIYEKTGGRPDGGTWVAATASEVALFSRYFEAVDISEYKDGYFRIFLYVQDVSKLTGGQIELTSSADADSNEMNWDLMTLGLVNGWNELYLPMNAAGSQNGTADLSAINYFRVYFLLNGTTEVGVDSLSVTKAIIDDNAKTGDPVGVVAALLAVSGLGCAVLLRKKEN